MEGAGGLVVAAEVAVSGVRGALSLAAGSPWHAGGTLAEWAAALEVLQGLLDVASAAQELAMARLAAVDVEYAEDGTVVERHRGPGQVSVDAAGVVAGVLGCTAVHAEARVRSAVRRAADGPAGTAGHTGLGGLHAAMAAGRLDGYRAEVVAAELEEAPAPVAATVVAALEPWFAVETGPLLRRRVRRLLARVSPDLLRQRARRARSACRLERWASEPGVDTWHGTFPSEEAALAWAAVDALAQRYVADGTCERVDRARAKALTDLVTGNAAVEVGVVLTVPQESVPPAAALAAAGAARGGGGPGAVTDGPGGPAVAPHPADLVEVPGLRPSEPMLVPRAWLDGLTRDAAEAAAASTASRRARRRLRVWACGSGTGAVLADVTDTVTGDAASASEAVGAAAAGSGSGPYRPSARLAELVRARDGHCRFPGCHVAARFCDLDHVRPWPGGPTTGANLVCLCRRHHRVKQRPGWSASPDPDGTLTWADPTGRVRITRPLDVLHPLVLPHRAGEPAHVPPRSRLVLPDAPHSALEFAFEHLLAAATARTGTARTRPAGSGTGVHAPRDSLPDDPPF